MIKKSYVAVLIVMFGFGSVVFPVIGQTERPEEKPLPGRGVVIDIDSPERALYKIAVPNLLGSTVLGPQAAEVLRNDFKLVSLFQILDPRSYLANPESEGLSIKPQSWTSIGAQGVIKGEIQGGGDSLTVDMRLFEIARGTTATLSRSYRGNQGQLRTFMHQFANDVLRVLTGQVGAFGTRLAFARRSGPGRKDVYVADFDGGNLGRISSGRGINMLPSFGAGGIWYSHLTERGMFITRSGMNERPLISGSGLQMGPVPCGNRVLFTSTRDGNSEIYSANTDGGDVRRITNHPAIDVSPSCGPGGQVAFVSGRHGSPQIFLMDVQGGNVRRVTFRGSHNQTPAWCPDASKSLLAFTGQNDGLDVFTVNVATQQYTRLTEGQGMNKDPAFSPDCRMVAFYSSRGAGGIYLSNPEGLNQNLVVPGHAETIRWSR